MPAYPTLRRRDDFQAVVRSGASHSSRTLVLRALATGSPDTRIGLATPQAIGGAVQRNRVRRRLRELVRERYGEMGSGWDVLIIAKPQAATATWEELRTEVGVLLTRAGALP